MDKEKSKNIFRPSGICIIAGSIILTVGYWMRPYIEKQFVQDFAGDSALYSSVLVGVGILAVLVGLPALFYSQAKEANSPGILSLALTFVGFAAFHLGTLALYFVLPVLATHSKDTLSLIAQDVPPFPRFAIFWALSLLVQVAGLISYGIKMLRSSEYPKIAAVTILAGALLLIISPPINFRLLQPAVTLVMAGFVVYGLTLLRACAAQTTAPDVFKSQLSN